MTTIYFEDGSCEYIINPRFDFRRVIEDRLGKDSADFFDEIIEEVEFETQTHDVQERKNNRMQRLSS